VAISHASLGKTGNHNTGFETVASARFRAPEQDYENHGEHLVG
jgi:hypothetical protein